MWLPGNFQVLLITWCLYCVTFSDATETGPILMPVLVVLVCRLDCIISPEFTSWVGIVPVNRKSSGFMQLVGGLYTHLFPLETWWYIQRHIALLRCLPLVEAYHRVVILSVMSITFAMWCCRSVMALSWTGSLKRPWCECTKTWERNRYGYLD